MKKVILFILIFSIVLSNFSLVAYGNNYVKEIDVGFNGMEIYVEDKKIPHHNEPFIYEDSIYISTKDLAKGLDLDYKINRSKKSIGLNSNGKLKVDGPNSKKIKSFQLGYEIEARERIIRDLEGIYYETNMKKPEIRNIKFGFGDWKLYLDNKKIDVDCLYYNDDLYVDILDISPYLYIVPSYKKDSNRLSIDANGILVENSHWVGIDNLLAFREGRNYLLNIQMEQLEKRIALEEDLRGIPYGKLNNIKDLEKYLNKHFGKIGDLPVSIKPSKTVANWIYLDISFSRANNYKWYKFNRKEIEDWVWDMYTAILKLYNDEALLHGAIRNPYYDYYSSSKYRNYVVIDTVDKDLHFDFSRSQLKKDYRFDSKYLVEILDKNLNKYNKVNYKYKISQSGEDIEIVIYPDSNSMRDWSLYTKMGYLKRLNWEIRRVYPDLNVNGSIVFPKDNMESIKFQIVDNRIRSFDLLRETEDYINLHYGNFTYGRDSFGIEYNLYEKGLDDLSLIVEGDFSINEDKWINGGDTVVQRLNTRVQNAISTIISLWDMNISTEVFDKNGMVITELDVYRKDVGIVYAYPEAGEVKEGTLVYLSTDTPGAEIYYTLDGSTPTTQSIKYSGPIVVSRDLTINAFGYKEGMGAGPVSSFKYTVIPDDGWSYGLKDLKISRGELKPYFSRDVLNYEINIDGAINNISLTPYADNSIIKINGESVSSGQEKYILLKEGLNTINISVQEENKREKIYTINVYRGSSSGRDIRIVDLQTSGTLVGAFKGRLSSNYVRDFSGYRVELWTRAGVHVETVVLGAYGNFSITGFPVDVISKRIGYKYRVYDGGGNLVLEEDLNI